MPPGKSVYPVTLALPALSGIVPSVLLPEALLLGLDVSRPEICVPGNANGYSLQPWLQECHMPDDRQCRGVCPLTLNQEPIAHIEKEEAPNQIRAHMYGGFAIPWPTIRAPYRRPGYTSKHQLELRPANCRFH